MSSAQNLNAAMTDLRKGHITLTAIRREYTTARDLAPFCKRYRPHTIRTLGLLLHPASVTNAWYAGNCGPQVAIPHHDRVRWAISRWLRGADSPAGRSAR